MRNYILAWLAALPLAGVAGCGAFPQDWRGTETVCDVHGVPLRADTVEVYAGHEGTVLEPDHIREAGVKFPNARLYVYADQPFGWPTRARVMSCPQCRTEREVWLKSWQRTHADTKPADAEPSGD